MPVAQRGLTLIELIMFIIVVGVGLAGVLSVLDVTGRSSADPVIRKQAAAIAESLMEEIVATPYACPGGATCNAVSTANRGQTHAVGDYNGFSMTGISALDGSPITEAHGGGTQVLIAVEQAIPPFALLRLALKNDGS